MNSMLVIILVVIIINTVHSSVRVCENYKDYYRSNGSTCSMNPDGYDTPSGNLQRWGCTVKEYNLVTDDGYKFLVIRAYMKISLINPIIMSHAIYANSRSFLSAGNKTLAYNLLKSGRQIFFINFRGTIYSTENINGLSHDDYEYWNFSFHHFGVHEVRKTVDLAYKITGQKSILIGYSMGTTANFVYSSLYPSETAIKVKAIIALAPIAILNTSIICILGKLAPFWPLIKPLVKLFGNGKILQRNKTILKFCSTGPIQMLLCYSVQVIILFDFNYGSIDFATRPVTVVNNPDAIGESVITHYSQVITNGQFQQYDYGTDENKKVYGTSKVPLYPLQDINVPVTLVVGKRDWVATKQTSEATWKKLSTDAQCKFILVPNKYFSHDDFINSKYQYEYLNLPLLTTISNMENGSCV